MARVTRDDLRGKVQTVLGPIAPEALGNTLMHEHLLCDLTPLGLPHDHDHGPEITLKNHSAIAYGLIKSTRNLDIRLKDNAIDEVKLMKQAGGDSIVELTCGGLRPDPNGLVDIAAATDVNVVMGCGYYVDDYQEPQNRGRSVDSFATEMVDQVQLGAWGTEVRAGIIGEIGCQAPWTDHEKTVMRGALIAQAETGASLNVHPGRQVDQPQEVADFIHANGGDPGRTIISHIDRTIFDNDRLLRLADSGVVIEFDLFGIEQSYYSASEIVDMPNDAVRLKHIRTLIDAGHLERIVISHDICYRTRQTTFGGHGYGHIYNSVVPMMRRRGFTQDEIDAILIGNPRRLLTFA